MLTSRSHGTFHGNGSANCNVYTYIGGISLTSGNMKGSAHRNLNGNISLVSMVIRAYQ
jgi:hypothetical protein